MTGQNLPSYYKKRADEYERIYFRNDPVRLGEQRHMADIMQHLFRKKNVLEVACGTGYWTSFLSLTAEKITATDYVEEVMNIAKTKEYGCPVTFLKEDAYRLSFADNSFNGGLANFWLSHVPKEKLYNFLQEFHRVLTDDAVIVLADNMYISGIGGDLLHKTDDENSYKVRKLADGSVTEVLKNYFTEEELEELVTPFAKKETLQINMGNCFWTVSYRKK